MSTIFDQKTKIWTIFLPKNLEILTWKTKDWTFWGTINLKNQNVDNFWPKNQNLDHFSTQKPENFDLKNQKTKMLTS